MGAESRRMPLAVRADAARQGVVNTQHCSAALLARSHVLASRWEGAALLCVP